MTFQQIIQKALLVRQKFSNFEKQKFGKSWSVQDLMAGFVGDVGDLSKLVQAKNGVRDIENVDQKLKHELVDCLWSIIVLADQFEVNLEEAFSETINDIENKLDEETKKNYPQSF